MSLKKIRPGESPSNQINCNMKLNFVCGGDFKISDNLSRVCGDLVMIEFKGTPPIIVQCVACGSEFSVVLTVEYIRR